MEILKTKKLSKNINTYIFSYEMSYLQNVHYAFLACLMRILKIPKQTRISEPGRSDITNESMEHFSCCLLPDILFSLPCQFYIS